MKCWMKKNIKPFEISMSTFERVNTVKQSHYELEIMNVRECSIFQLICMQLT